jgi:hypothetical protein
VVLIDAPNIGKLLRSGPYAASGTHHRGEHLPHHDMQHHAHACTCLLGIGAQGHLQNVASVSIPSERQFIQEGMVKGRKDKKKKKNDNNDVREEKRQLDGKGGEGLGRVDAIRIDNEDNNSGWGDVGEGMLHR